MLILICEASQIFVWRNAQKDLGGNTLALNCFSLGATVEYGDKLSRH